MPLAEWIELPQFVDERGRLGALGFSLLPFVPCRLFTIDRVSPGSRRGGHGHRTGTQFLICLSGRVQVEMRRGGERGPFHCKPHGRGLLIRPGIWARQTIIDAGSRLLVVCSHPCDPDARIGAEEACRR